MEEKYLLDKHTVSTGITDLDIILSGGFTKASTVAVLGPVGIEKLLFGLYFMSTKQTRNFYATFDMSIKEINQRAEQYNIHLNVEKFLDGYSKQSGVEVEKGAIELDGATDLNNLSLEINKILHSLNKWQTGKFLIHSFSTLMLYNPINSVTKFMQVIDGRIKAHDGILMILIEKGLHKENDLNLILRNCDYVMNVEKKDKMMWSISLSFLPFPIQFNVGSEGITIL